MGCQVRQELDNQDHRLELAHPAARVRAHQQRLDESSERLDQALRRHMEQRQHRLALSYRRLLAGLEQTVQQYRWRLDAAMRNLRQALHAKLEQANGTLEAVSPLRTLERGYSIATLKTPTGPELIRKTRQIRAGDAFDLRLSDGSISAEVIEAEQKSEKE